MRPAPPAVAPLRTNGRRAGLAVASVLVFGYLPMVFLGPGTDLDVGGVWRSGQAILDGDYEVSRLPGSPVFEAVTGVLHAVGGSALVNLGSLAMAALTAWALVALLRREGVPHAGWAALVVIVHPVVWVAGTSMVDFLWATALLLCGALLQRNRPLAAGLLYALAAGCRASSIVIAAAFVVADLVGRDRDVRPRVALAGGVAVALTAVIYLPPLLVHGWSMFDNEVPTSTVLVQVGRFGVKNLFFFGVIVVAVVLALVPRLLAAGRARWATSWAVRAGALAFVASQVLFLRFPWKLAHLIPALLALVLLLGGARLLSARLLAVLVAANLLLGVVTVRLAEPDQPGLASGADLSPAVVEGQLLRDLRCRLDGDRDAYRRDDGFAALGATWRCVVPWGAEGDADTVNQPVP